MQCVEKEGTLQKSLTKTMTKEGDDKNGNKHRRIKPNSSKVA
jgi:hypothetical protein